MPMTLPWLHPMPGSSGVFEFPNPETALLEPNGLLALGGDLSVERLIAAYSAGIFPWFSEGEPILWWSPNPRTVILPGRVHISQSLQKTLNKNTFQITHNKAFAEVLEACSQARKIQKVTWITNEMKTGPPQKTENKAR